MKSISVGELRQNPTVALTDVERGETYMVTRHRREIALLVPISHRRPVTAADLAAVWKSTPVDAAWSSQLVIERGDADSERDPWSP